MSDIKNEYEKLKELIQPQNIADRISVWEDHTKVSAPYNALKQAVTIIRHFETTIESQKEEIESLQDAFEMLPPKDVEIHERTQFKINETVSRLLTESLQKEIESLKAITELAVKWLKEVLYFSKTGTNSFESANSTLSEIERLQNGTT